ncbi:HNH endonuclease [Prescottella agglutinans]|uniref:HNH nuclease domain-containing protein n=1 Tax=Prescottella agglutinans TaxID=1644129 RepID=A0ABT6MFY7_9NOCA|nr:HNH endonuclease [Prescottella agglutinans]MDH6283135.1 hypothetical protein [Prescottella agglutinans]
MAVPNRLRYEVLRRDNHACRYCGGAAPEVKLTIDHVVPVALGGGDEPSNLVTACRDCNSGKTSTTPDAPIVDDVAQRAQQWAEAMAQVAAERAQDRQVRDFIRDTIAHMWDCWQTSDGQTKPRASDWKNSIDTFYAAGLDLDDFEDLIESTMTCRGVTDRWRYFCGCCWTRIKQNQKRAAEILEGQER